MSRQAVPLTFSQKQFNAYKLGLAEKRPVHLLTVFNGENLIVVERSYPPLNACSCWGKYNYGPICKHCKNPQPRWYMMDEKEYGPKAYLCGNCEQISYLKG
jgi:hypothetical protein